ncbi:MAG: response regulator [Deltaproteobacteria bacterium]|nr:response regulator [Deltaproteobacteria bacterium]
MANILVIEDDANVRGILSEILRLQGHDVEEAQDGEQGIALVQKRGPFSMVITDIRMPGMDGNEFARHMKGSPHLKDIPIVAITGYANDAERDLFSLVIEKPFNVKQLSNVIKFFVKEGEA